MAERFDDIQAQRAARAAEFSGQDEVAPPDFTDIGSPPLFDTEGVAAEPQWSIEGVAPQRADIFEAVIAEPIERWTARPRTAGFAKNYSDLDPVLDADLIFAEGLTYSAPIAAWIGYYPGMTSTTQIGKVVEFVVGSSGTFTITGISLAGTAYTPNYRLFGQDHSAAATQFAGTITAVNYSTNTITVTATLFNRTIQPVDPTQTWSLATTGIVQLGAE